jgi:hypothetical protein
MIKSREIDDRNQLYRYMRYQYTIGLPQFFDVRDWCWAHWGSGIEAEHFKNYARTVRKRKPWAWECSKYQGAAISNGKIYLPDDDDMKALFTLTWCGNDT